MSEYAVALVSEDYEVVLKYDDYVNLLKLLREGESLPVFKNREQFEDWVNGRTCWLGL